MIHDYYDYYLSEAKIKKFDQWDKEKEGSFHQENKKEEWKKKDKNEKYCLWLDEIFVKPLAMSKRKIRNKLSEAKNLNEFYPQKEDLQSLSNNSTLIIVSFILKKPYTSKDDTEFYLLEYKEEDRGEKIQKIIENPIARDKFTGLPMVRPSTWKGHLRFAAERVEGYENCKRTEIIRRLFGDEKNALKGRLYFFPTFFESETEKDINAEKDDIDVIYVITPLKRDTRTPARGSIPLEVVKPGKSEKPEKKAEFYLLYIPYPRGDNFKEEQIKEDLEFLAEALKLMFYTYGFSAKKTSGFGVIGNLEENGVNVHPDDKKKYFSILYTKVNKNVNHGVD